MNRKRRKRALMPRLGPAQNVRPAGAHEAKTAYNRKRQKAALRRYDEDGFFVSRLCGTSCISLRISAVRGHGNEMSKRCTAYSG